MRILLFSGKGGVGKTSLAAATGVRLAQLKYRTLVMSIDPAHSLADAFDLDTDLFHATTSDPLAINDRLSIQELNIQKEIKRHWQEISSYVSFGAAHHRHQRRGGRGAGHPARHGRAERDDVHQPVPAREAL